MSRLLPLALALMLAGPSIGTAAAQTAVPTQPRPAPSSPTPAPEPARRSSLDDLFVRLAAAKDEEEAKGIAGLIERRLERSGSDTADLLLQRSGEALRADDPALAVELIDRVTQLRPGWAEAWNRRASAFFRLDDPGQAIADLQEALTREPRHFVAWTALGHLELQGGNKPRALAAYRRAVRIYPQLEEARKMVERLEPEVDGRDL